VSLLQKNSIKQERIQDENSYAKHPLIMRS